MIDIVPNVGCAHFINVDEDGSDAVFRRRPHARDATWHCGAAREEWKHAAVGGANPQRVRKKRRGRD